MSRRTKINCRFLWRSNKKCAPPAEAVPPGRGRTDIRIPARRILPLLPGVLAGFGTFWDILL